MIATSFTQVFITHLYVISTYINLRLRHKIKHKNNYKIKKSQIYYVRMLFIVTVFIRIVEPQ